MSTTYHTLAELLEGEGHESPYRFGRALYKYTDCGPWVTFVTPGIVGSSFGRHEVYYEDAAARGWASRFWGPRCTGIRIGSIVEGSDAEVGPITLTFPFSNEHLWDAVQEIDKEACLVWDEANTEETV
jgi:hypothetical protein